MDRKTRLAVLQDFKQLPRDEFLKKYPGDILEDFFTSQKAALERQSAGRRGNIKKKDAQNKMLDARIKMLEQRASPRCQNAPVGG